MRKISMKGKRESFLVVSCRAQISLSLCFSLVLISPSRQTRVGKSNYKLLNVKQELPCGTWSNCHALLYFLTSFHSPGRPRTPSVEQADLLCSSSSSSNGWDYRRVLPCVATQLPVCQVRSKQAAIEGLGRAGWAGLMPSLRTHNQSLETTR